MFKLMSRAVCHIYKQRFPVGIQKITSACTRATEFQHRRAFSVLQHLTKNDNLSNSPSNAISERLSLLQTFKPCIISNMQQTRSVTKFSLKKGKRKTVKAVLRRFYRLNWGGWIRTRAGRHKHLWKKSSALRNRLKEHVFVNGQQSWLLDSMVTNYWRKPKYYVDDPYEPYHQREEYIKTRRKPFRG